MEQKKPQEIAESSAAGSIFGLLKPYKGLVSLLVLFALAGNSINLVIPLIISR
jgi:ATP-binding cassette subfamily B protein